ncbi:hypothetical protein ACWC10_19725 [Streptomyces sp. NPDC001595]
MITHTGAVSARPASARTLASVIGWVSPDAPRQLLRAVDDHLRQEHAAPS